MERESTSPKLHDHVIIFNCNQKVKTIVEELQEGTLQPPLDVIIVIQDKKMWNDNKTWHPESKNSAQFIEIFGDPFDQDTLNRANVENARAALILADPYQDKLADAKSTLIAVEVEKNNPQVHTVQELILSMNREHLKAMNVDEVICFGEISEKLIAQSCISPGVKNIFGNLLSAKEGTPQIVLLQLTQKYNGMTYHQIATMCIKGDAPFIIIGFAIPVPGLTKKGTLKNTIAQSFLVNPQKKGKDMPLSEYDQLIIITYEKPPDMNIFFDKCNEKNHEI